MKRYVTWKTMTNLSEDPWDCYWRSDYILKIQVFLTTKD